MLTRDIYFSVLSAWVFLALVIFPVLMFVSAPYGRFFRPGWGPTIRSSANWFLMESPAVIVFATVFVAYSQKTSADWCFFCFWNFHYLYRSFIYPWLIRSQQPVPLVIMACGAFYNLTNAWLQATWLFCFAAPLNQSWFWSPYFVVGAFLFACGFMIHVRADSQLRQLRRNFGPGYHIPRQGFFRWISCPNYFGELVQWIGWSLLTCSWSGLAFVVWTFSNLVPRALTTHRWYLEKFPEYPPGRKAILPFLL